MCKTIGYEGKVKIVELDLDNPNSLEKADKELVDFIELEENEELYVNLHGSRLEVKKLKKIGD